MIRFAELLLAENVSREPTYNLRFDVGVSLRLILPKSKAFWADYGSSCRSNSDFGYDPSCS
jgi:hypothetical protein